MNVIKQKWNALIESNVLTRYVYYSLIKVGKKLIQEVKIVICRLRYNQIGLVFFLTWTVKRSEGTCEAFLYGFRKKLGQVGVKKFTFSLC